MKALWYEQNLGTETHVYIELQSHNLIVLREQRQLNYGIRSGD